MRTRHYLLSMFVSVGLLAAAVGCGGGNEPGTREVPVAPEIQELRAESNPVGPGQSAKLAVYAAESGTDLATGDEMLAGSVPEGWQVEWTVDSGDWSITGDGATASLTAPDSYEAATTVAVIVTDGEDQSATAEIDVATGTNRTPNISGISADPNPADAGSDINLKVEAGDPNGDELTYAWEGPDGWSFDDPAVAEPTVTAPDEQDVFADLTVRVSDGYGGEDSTRIRVQTKSNAPPSVSAMTANPPQVKPAGTTSIEVVAQDPEGADLTYNWTLPSGWTADSPSGPTVELTAPDAYGQTGLVEVAVEDPAGGTATGRVLVSTRENDGPIISSLTTSSQPVDKGGTVDLTVNAQDPNGDSLTYTWSVMDDQKWNLAPMGSRALVTSPNEPSASTVVEVTVEDAEGKSATASALLSTKANTAPSIASLSANPQTVQPGGQATVSASATDADGDSLTYSWSATGNWSVSGMGKQVTVTAPAGYDKAGSVSVEVSDGFGGKATANTLLTTTSNDAPVISSVIAQPTVVSKGGTTQVTASATDPNGDTLSYAWSVPTDWTKSGSGNQIQVTAPDKSNASATIQVTVTDGQGGTAQGAVAIQTPTNQPPRITQLSANPQTVARKGTVTLTSSAKDPEADPLTYTWTVPSGWTKNGSGSDITVTAPDTYSDTGTITLEVSDGQDTTTQTVMVQTEANKPPTIQSLSANPDPVVIDSTTTVTATASDPGSDALTYGWSLNNPNWSMTGSGSSITLQAPNTLNSTVTVTLTVDDGNGGTDSDQLTLKTIEEVKSVWQCGKHSGQYVFIKNTDNQTINSHDDFGAACQHYGLKIPLTSKYPPSNRWANTSAPYAVTTGCHNCRWTSSHKISWNSYEPDGTTRPGGKCTYVSGAEIPSGTIVVGAIYNHDATKLSCATIKDRMHTSYTWGAGVGDDWYQFYSDTNDPNCSSQRQGPRGELAFTGTPDWLMCAR